MQWNKKMQILFTAASVLFLLWSVSLRENSVAVFRIARARGGLGEEHREPGSVRQLKNISVFPIPLELARGLHAMLGAPSMERDVQGRDRSPSYPLISGDGFRHLCRLRCEDPDCNFKAEDVGEGDCIYLAAGNAKHLRAYREMSARISKPHVVVTHNGDMSTPDGDDWHKDATGKQLASMEPPEEFSSLLSLPMLRGWFASNCNWKSSPAKPAKLHCLPTGIENRYDVSLKKENRYDTSVCISNHIIHDGHREQV